MLRATGRRACRPACRSRRGGRSTAATCRRRSSAGSPPAHADGLVHRPLFALLDDIDDVELRGQRFVGYMAAHFHLTQPQEAGHSTGKGRTRTRAGHQRVVRGWAFDSGGREAAVLKGRVESRFGLMPRHHAGSLREPGSDFWQRHVSMCAAGLYATNALESQPDLLYAYCQYELARQFPLRTHLRLYRGVNRLSDHEIVSAGDPDGPANERIVLPNNVSSFSRSRERAGEFGDTILRVDVPLPRPAFYNELLPGMLKSKAEYVVIGGLYGVRLATL